MLIRLLLKIMNENLTGFEEFEICGLNVKLTKSQSENSIIAQTLWRKFNYALKRNNIVYRDKKAWEKYGVIYKADNEIYYLTGIRSNNVDAIPLEFSKLIVPAGNYYKYTHKGSMNDIKVSVKDLFKNKLLDLNYINPKSGIIYFERYDSRFNWNNPASEIDLFVLVKESNI